jgi:peptide/nickel transport system substrate-binding protein
LTSRRVTSWALGAAAAALAAAGLLYFPETRSPERSSTSPAGPALPQAGGSLDASIRGEPRSFNRYASRDTYTDLVALLTHARLVQVDRTTDRLEPALAERWDGSVDGLVFTLFLRSGVAWSDGAPFTADDAAFALEAVYDERTASPLRDVMLVDGRPLAFSAKGPLVLEVRFPAPYGPGIRILDNLPILPRHRLAEFHRAGTLASAWDVATPPANLAGLGPFVLAEYRPGERLVFTRNPRYWRRDEQGAQLPYLDRLTLQIVPDQNAELLRLQAGQVDLTQNELRPEDYLPLKRAADAGALALHDLGIGLDADGLWFSLGPRPGAEKDPRRAWLTSEAFRHAVSLAVDRKAFVDAVFLGAAVPIHSPVTPGNRRWYAEDLPGGAHDPARARALLAELGLADRTSDGTLEDASGAAVRFATLVLQGNTAAERGASFLRAELAKVGVAVDIAPLEFGAFVKRLVSGDYDAVYYRLQTTDPDPAVNMDFWLSSGSAHVWHMGQAAPATPWEKTIDDLMRRQAATTGEAERKRLFDEVQRVFVAHEPVVYFAAPRVFTATSRRVAHVTPAVLRPQLLWNAAAISVRDASAAH